MKRIGLLMMTMAVATGAAAQDGRSSSSMYLKAQKKADVSVSYNISGEGTRFSPRWGVDLAWINEQNIMKGLNHMGADNVNIGRTSFRVLKALGNNNALTSDMISGLSQRANLFNKISPTLPLVMNCDNGYMPEGYEGPYINTYYTENRNNVNVNNWAAVIEAHVKWMRSNTQHPIEGVSPFNEPDNAWEKNLTGEIQGNADDEAAVARALRANSTFEGVVICGGNTLNDDNAVNWYSKGSDVYDWGNTHQLAGSMDNYIAFYERLKTDGKVGYNDEMHNVVEAMTGLEHGLSVGIWWGFDSRARGEFCDISRHGVRLAYGEHRNNWTAASVYKHDDGRVKAFVGSSERQAKTTSYQLVSADRDVYYDGYGPVREYIYSIPGGNGYQKGQTNAEKVIDITWGEQIAPHPFTAGTYCIANYVSGGVIANPGNGNDVKMQKYKANTEAQQWNIAPATNRTGGDLSFYDIEAVSNNKIRLNVKNYSLSDNGVLIAWTQDLPSSNEQWYMEYAGNGCYYLRNRESALYMTAKGTSKTAGVCQMKLQKEGTTARQRQMWRLLPVDVTFEKNAPKAPTALNAVAQSASVKVSWAANSESDLNSYMVLRAEKETEQWNVIARELTDTWFVDNTCRQGRAYIYKVVAVDKAQNISAASETAEATPTGEPAMIARWQLDGSLNDETANMMDAVSYSAPTYITTDFKSGEGSAFIRNSNFLQLPYEIASSDELTFACWVKWTTTSSWQRLFDFGTDTDHYMFLTPSNGTAMTFAIKNGGEEQKVTSTSKLTTNQWKHVAVTIGNNKTTIYVDGTEVASSSAITIKPSDLRPALNYIGRSQFSSDPYFTGYLDDIRIYNYALNADEVKAAMNDTESGIEDIHANSQKPIVNNRYDLQGRKVTTAKGLQIINNKKVILK